MAPPAIPDMALGDGMTPWMGRPPLANAAGGR